MVKQIKIGEPLPGFLCLGLIKTIHLIVFYHLHGVIDKCLQLLNFLFDVETGDNRTANFLYGHRQDSENLCEHDYDGKESDVGRGKKDAYN